MILQEQFHRFQIPSVYLSLLFVTKRACIRANVDQNELSHLCTSWIVIVNVRFAAINLLETALKFAGGTWMSTSRPNTGSVQKSNYKRRKDKNPVLH